MMRHSIPYVWLTSVLTAASLLTSCAKQTYHPQPISVESTAKKLAQQSPSHAGFNAYLIKQGYPNTQLPIQSWGLDELTLSALYFHQDLTLAKAQLSAAESNIALASLKPPSTVGGTFGRSNQANGDISPWTYSLQVDIPIETANKREIRIEEAQLQADIARMDVAEAAWLLRQRLSLDLIDYQQNIGNIALLQQEVNVHSRLVTLYTKRLSQGLASNVELAKAQLLRQKKYDLLLREQANTLSILRKIATDAGLPTTPFTPEQMQTWQAPDLLMQQNAALSQYTPATLQESALLNRVDIRRSLAQYAVAETKIKLEIAKQTPDISLTPGLLFEFGDKIWSLGFSSLLALANQHGTQIKQAEQLRAVEGARFEALQAKVTGEVAQRWVEYHALNATLNQLLSTKNLEQQAQVRLQKQLEAGLLDRLALTEASLNSLALAQQVHDTQFALLRALANLEHAMQKPLLNTSRYLAPQ